MAVIYRGAKSPAVHRSTGGDAQSRLFTELYTKHFEFVWRSLRALGASADVAEDAAQDVFLVAHRRLADFDVRDSPRTWLFAIAMHVMNAQRRSWRRRMRLLARAQAVDPEPVGTPFEKTIQSEMQRALRDVLDSLPEPQRVVFVLSDIEEMTAPQISATLGVNLNTVYSRLRVARRELSDRLTQRVRRDARRTR